MLPQMYGVGYPVLENAVEGKYLVPMLLLLLVGKMFATSLTIGIGGSGGVFAPTLFIGAMAGTAFGAIAHDMFPTVTESAGAYGLIGMGAALGGATRAPITAVVILFELTGEYSIILPLMAAVVMAAGTGRLLSKDTIYTAKLWRRGVDLDNPPRPFPTFTASDVLRDAPTPMSQDVPLDAAAATLAAAPYPTLPVIDADGTYRGCVSAADIADALDDSDPPKTIRTLVGLPPMVSAETGPGEILAALHGHGGTGLPVLDTSGTAVIGWVTYETVLARMHPGIGGTS